MKLQESYRNISKCIPKSKQKTPNISLKKPFRELSENIGMGKDMSERKVKRTFDIFLGKSLDLYWKCFYQEVESAQQVARIEADLLRHVPVENHSRNLQQKA